MKHVSRKWLIEQYINFFKKKGHEEIPSSSLVPQNDPTVLFTTAGMHPLVPFLIGQPHPLGKRLVNIQKCIRTGDVDQVGDENHHTFFEMLGNWSLGDYSKEEAIKYTFEFHNKILGIPLEKYAISVFAGNKDIPKDEESAKVWISLGVPKERIAYLGDNWWGPAGETGPCGPDTEQFYYIGKKAPKKFDSKDKNWVEIGNDVLMQYEKTRDGKFIPLNQKNIDFGGGLDRTLSVLNGLEDDYKSEIFYPIIKEIEKISGKKYNKKQEYTRAMRIIADHIKAATFIISDGVSPGNVERGYVLRRLIRRAIRYGNVLGIEKNFTSEIAEIVIKIYQDYYPELKIRRNEILIDLEKEENKFKETLSKGLKEFEKIARKSKNISGKEAFLLYQSYGFPLEMTVELANEKKMKVDNKEFLNESKKHQELSRTTSSGAFKSGLADNSDIIRRLHTATHLLNEVLREVLSKDIRQKGSNITSERLRFDFNFPRKLNDDEIKKIESLLNKKIHDSLNVKREEMSLKDAISTGAQAEFGAKYPEKVSVYTILNKEHKKGWFSREICTGPHVKNTKEIGKFKIIKEESVAAGIRRIKAIVE